MLCCRAGMRLGAVLAALGSLLVLSGCLGSDAEGDHCDEDGHCEDETALYEAAYDEGQQPGKDDGTDCSGVRVPDRSGFNKRIALTFDDGPSPATTPQVIEVLKRHNAPAAFFIWLSVLNLFVVSVFWSFMADVWREEQARRLFGFIAAGGSAGAMAGPAITAALAARVGPVNLLPLSALMLAGALVCIVRLRRWALAPEHGPAARAAQEEAPLGGSPFAGLTGVLRSAYLLGICGFVALGNLLGTFIYFQQALVIRAAYAEPGERTAVFAMMDLAVNAITILAQLFVTGRLAVWLGLPRLLAALPPQRLSRVLRRAQIPAHTDRAITDADEMLAEIEAVRRQGWAASRQELNENNAVAATVFGADGAPVLLVAALGFASQLDEGAIPVVGSALRELTRAATRESGGRVPEHVPDIPLEAE